MAVPKCLVPKRSSSSAVSQTSRRCRHSDSLNAYRGAESHRGSARMADKMRFGIYCEMQNGFGVDYARNVWDVFSLIENADQLGYDVFSIIDHHFFQEFSISVNPLALFSAAAQRTRNIRFRTLCHTLPLRNPVVYAGEMAFADILTQGRLDLGVGRGQAWEYPPAGIPMEETQGRYEEALEILELAFT